MNRRLSIKRSDAWSKSQDVIKLTKGTKLKAACAFNKDFCQQSRVQRHSLLFFLLKCHARNSLSAGAKSFPRKKILLLKRYQMESACTRHSIGLGSLYVDRRFLKDHTGLLYSWKCLENIKKWQFCLKSCAEQKGKSKWRVLRLSEHCCLLWEQRINSEV